LRTQQHISGVRHKGVFDSCGGCRFKKDLVEACLDMQSHPGVTWRVRVDQLEDLKGVATAASTQDCIIQVTDLSRPLL
jgi:hypothetical protein